MRAAADDPGCDQKTYRSRPCPEDIIITLERQMKYGIGLCRHCHLDDMLIGEDGPVFRLAELLHLEIMEL